MPKMIARGKGLVHDGRHYNAGDTFDASDVDARYYRRRDMADDAPAAPVVVPPPKTQRAPVVARAVVEPAPVVTPAPDEPSPGASNVAAATVPYHRRDLRAED